MRIAIQAADLDAPRIDGTRVYIYNLLKYFGSLDAKSEFFVYHKKEFNPELVPPEFPNYKIKKINFPALWTQARFAWELRKDKPDVLWMPMHNIPLVRSKKMKTFVTVHDLAYKYFPDYFPKKDLLKLNLLGDLAIKNADKLVAISESTKRDILKFYPTVREENIRVIHHGFDTNLFGGGSVSANILDNYQLQSKKYVLYNGAIQPRKNLERLIEAFEILKKEEDVRMKNLKLAIVGEKAWLSDGILKKAENSQFREHIVMPGKVKFEDLAELMKNAAVYVFPSLYEGFGIPILEAMASGVPVVAADNSSLKEVGGGAAEYFDAYNANEMAEKIKRVLADDKLKQRMIAGGAEQAKKFSWEKCAQETLEYLKS